jgi:hypothetical protein
MGLKTTNYEAKEFGIILPTAYARLINFNVNLNGEAFGMFEIHQTRNDIGLKKAIERKDLEYVIDTDLPIHKQLYEKAKEELFIGWEDDIIE